MKERKKKDERKKEKVKRKKDNSFQKWMVKNHHGNTQCAMIIVHH